MAYYLAIVLALSIAANTCYGLNVWPQPQSFTRQYQNPDTCICTWDDLNVIKLYTWLGEDIAISYFSFHWEELIFHIICHVLFSESPFYTWYHVAPQSFTFTSACKNSVLLGAFSRYQQSILFPMNATSKGGAYTVTVNVNNCNEALKVLVNSTFSPIYCSLSVSHRNIKSFTPLERSGGFYSHCWCSMLSVVSSSSLS